MSERFWKNLCTAFGWLSIGMLFAMATFSSSAEIRDLDLWLHLRMGWWICQHGFVPNYDVLSCAIAGKPWVNHEWLFQVLVYQIQKNYGFDGLIAMQSFVVGLTFLVLVFLGYSRERIWLMVATLAMVLMVYETRFTIRPDIFSLLFFVLYIYILALHLNKRWTMYALLVIQILWSNMHGFFFFGPLLVMVGILSEFIKRRVPLPYEWNSVGRLPDEEYHSLKLILPVVLLACCINPLTFKGAWYPVSVFFHLAGSNKIFFEHIVELQRPITADTIWSTQYQWYKVLIFISGISFIFNRRKIDISSLLIWVIFLLFSLAAVRNMVFFAMAAYIVFMVNCISTPWEDLAPLRFSSYQVKYFIVLLIILKLMFWMLDSSMDMAGNGYFDFDTYMRKSAFFGVSKRVYPYKAVDFLVQQKIKGNFFNDFNSGAYLIGRDYPNIRVFIDGRTEVYGADFFETYEKVWKDGDAKVFAGLEKKYGLTGALLNNAHQDIPPAVLKMFHSFKDWSIVYLDDDGIVFLKQTPYNKPFIDRFLVDLNKWKVRPLDLMRASTSRIDPFPFTSRAYILENLGADDAAFKEAKEALAVAPAYGPAFYILGEVYTKRHDYKKMFECYRLAAMYVADTPSRVGLAESYEHLKDYKDAIEQYQKALNMPPAKNKTAYFGMARCYAKEGQDKKALDMLAEAAKMGLEDKVDVQRIHDIINGSKKKVTDKQPLKKK